ncbi:MAG: alpha,alpha-trehalose-phosphate synthase [Ilumatobacter sp.]|nr:MAG: alpha,alpha-trehalose-phosphate synthase [Ilumatobacter sp.]
MGIDTTPIDRAPELVLATDLDGTFLGGNEPQRRALYDELLDRADEVMLVFVTGRDLDFIADLVSQPGMPRPDMIIGDVGTTVVHGHDFSPVEEVQSWIDRRWDDSNEMVLDLLRDEPGLELQPIMGSRRVSYYYDPTTLQRSTIAKVEDAGLDVIISAGVFLDVLPKGIAKGPTLLRVIDAFELSDERVLVAGDTLNDLSLFHTGLQGVAVGNSEPGLVDAIADLPTVHHSELPGCAGITDAIDHFGFFARTA